MANCLYCGNPITVLQQWKLGRGKQPFCSLEHQRVYSDLQVQALKRLMVRGVALESGDDAPAELRPVPAKAAPELAEVAEVAVAPEIPPPPAVAVPREVVVVSRGVIPVPAPPVPAAAEPKRPDSPAMPAKIPLAKLKPADSARRNALSISPKPAQLRPVQATLQPAAPGLPPADYLAVEFASPEIAVPDSGPLAQALQEIADANWRAPVQTPTACAAFEGAVGEAGPIPIEGPPPSGRSVVPPHRLPDEFHSPYEFFDATSRMTLPVYSGITRASALGGAEILELQWRCSSNPQPGRAIAEFLQAEEEARTALPPSRALAQTPILLASPELTPAPAEPLALAASEPQTVTLCAGIDLLALSSTAQAAYPVLAFPVETAPHLLPDPPAFMVDRLIGPPVAPPARECLTDLPSVLLALKASAPPDEVGEPTGHFPPFQAIPIDALPLASEPVFTCELLPLTRFAGSARQAAVC